MPPDGNEEASGSPLMSSLPEKAWIAPPSTTGLRKESCFSAVKPVMGWNQCVKCVAPCSTAQSFIASATASAWLASSWAPASTVRRRAWYTSGVRRLRCTASLKTRELKISVSGRKAAGFGTEREPEKVRRTW